MVTEEDIKKYLDKSGDSFIYEDNIVVNEHGFMSWNIHEGKLVLLNVYGNGKGGTAPGLTRGDDGGVGAVLLSW